MFKNVLTCREQYWFFVENLLYAMRIFENNSLWKPSIIFSTCVCMPNYLRIRKINHKTSEILCGFNFTAEKLHVKP